MGEWEKKREVMERYDLTAHIYDMRYAEEQEAKFDVALKSLKANNNGMVLDAGCGTGLLFGHVASKAEIVVGLEISKKTLLKAKERAGGFRNVHLVMADADFMPFREGAFSIVFAFTLIQNVPDPAKTLREIRRVAENNAQIVVTGLKKIFSLQVFKSLLRNSGLEIVSFDAEGLKCYVATCLKFSSEVFT